MIQLNEKMNDSIVQIPCLFTSIHRNFDCNDFGRYSFLIMDTLLKVKDFFKVLLKCVTIVCHLKKYQEKMESHCLHFVYSEVGHPGTITYRRGLLLIL